MKDFSICLLVLSYNLTVVSGAAYLVYYKGASAWLFLLVLFLLASYKPGKKKFKIDGTK